MEQKAGAGHGASNLAAARATDAGGRQGSSDLAHALTQALSKPEPAAGSSATSPPIEPPHQKGRTLQACGEGWCHTPPSPADVSPIQSHWRQSQLSTLPGLPWGCEVATVTSTWAPLSMLERRGAMSTMLQQPSQQFLHSKGFPVSLLTAPVCSAGGRPLACLEVQEQMKSCSVVLSCW